jgi:citrate synthase
VSPNRKRLKSDLGWSTADRVVVQGHDLVDLIGKVSLGDFAFLELKGRLPNPEESAVFNAVAVTLVEHGMTPSAIAARLTYFGAPESLQAAVAAGLLGMGSRFGGSIEEAARILQEALAGASPDTDLGRLARTIVATYRKSKQPIAGLGHPIHKPVDPRTVRLFEVALENGLSGRYVELMKLISEEASRAYGRELPVNATGAIGAILGELEIPWQVGRGVAVMARAIGLVAHIQEEQAEPMAAEIWSRVEEEASEQNLASPPRGEVRSRPQGRHRGGESQD